MNRQNNALIYSLIAHKKLPKQRGFSSHTKNKIKKKEKEKTKKLKVNFFKVFIMHRFSGNASIIANLKKFT